MWVVGRGLTTCSRKGDSPGTGLAGFAKVLKPSGMTNRVDPGLASTAFPSSFFLN